MNTLLTVNPLKPFVRLATSLWRWCPRPAQEVPIERPPRSRAPESRTHVVWSGGQLHPFPLTMSEPEREEHWRR